MSNVQSVTDPFWAEVALDEPVLAELVESEPVQRLKGIHQAGASFYLYPDRRPTTRFEHSVGVMQILTVMGAGLEERVAGLLHDVPHTAFSHTVDILFPSTEHNFHERFQHEVVMRSRIPSILAKHAVDLRAALEPDSFSLLERPLPDLCADRIDYSLRDLHSAGLVSRERAAQFLSHLVPAREGLVVDGREEALWFSRLFLRANDTFWTGAAEAGAYWALAGAIKRAYEIGGFTDRDLFSTDDVAMQTLRSLNDPVVDGFLALLEPGTQFYDVESDGPCFITHMKQRAVDPLVSEGGEAVPLRLSQLVPAYADELAERKAQRRTTYRLWASRIAPELGRIVDVKQREA